jgi:N-acetylglucosaminyldiphosphoundecaprenol N-acetyl-beta-D-mannosaminyltransferase
MPTKSLEKQGLPPRYEILGLGVDDLTLAEAVDLLHEWVLQKRSEPHHPGSMVITVNPEYVMAARNDVQFREIVAQAALRTPDGAGLLGCGYLWGRPFRERVTGVALTHALAKHSAVLSKSGQAFRLFLLGAAPGVAELAATKLQTLYPGVQIAGTYAGLADPSGDRETVDQVRTAQADIVLVAYGMGSLKQDGWMVRNLNTSGAAVAIGVGGVFDYLAGRVKLAPPLIRKMGLEWLYRLYQEPRRWRRMLVLPHFLGLVIWQLPAQRLAKCQPNKYRQE